jgi:hypothetical protein
MIGKEKRLMTDINNLRSRHSGNYTPTSNGERYLLPYEVELRKKTHHFFTSLSKYDPLNPNQEPELSLKGLREELLHLDNTEKLTDFWDNFTGYALKKYLNPILTTNNWRKTYLKQSRDKTLRPYHNEMLKCLYVLAHLHRADPSFIGELAKVGNEWSGELRLYYPRLDILKSEQFSACIAQLFSDILHHKPECIRVVTKNLDQLIDWLVKDVNHPQIAHMLTLRSDDTDGPGLKILKHSQIATITHNNAINMRLKDAISGDYSSVSMEELARLPHKHTTAKHYHKAAIIMLRYHNGPISPEVMLMHPEYLTNAIRTFANGLAADALRGLKLESKGTKDGKKDTSLAASIRTLVEKNPKPQLELLQSLEIDFSGIPELHSKYLEKRIQYVMNHEIDPEINKTFLAGMGQPFGYDTVLDYIRGNNLEAIYKHFEEYGCLAGLYFPRGVQPLPDRH